MLRKFRKYKKVSFVETAKKFVYSLPDNLFSFEQISALWVSIRYPAKEHDADNTESFVAATDSDSAGDDHDYGN